MSLLDQLSSLCVQSAAPNYQPSFFSFSLDQPSSNLVPPSRPHSVEKQNNEPSSEAKMSRVHNSEQKMIKLFDDEDLKPSWKLIKTDKKSNSKPNNEINQDKNLSEFTVDHPKNDNQAILTKFTKVFYLFNTKLRKMNYEFFVKLQKYSKALQKQQAKKQQENRKMKLLTIEKGFHKLTQTLQIINLKYFQPESQQITTQNVHNKKSQAFTKIKSNFYFGKKLSHIEKFVRKSIYRNFFTKFQYHNKTLIKIDLFAALLDSILKKKNQEKFELFFLSLKERYQVQTKLNQNVYVQIPKNFHERQQHFILPVMHPEISINLIAQLRVSFPLRFFMYKSVNINLSEENHLNFNSQGPENIPLKLHNLKSHQQQTNLNDCIDNGHLLMNQLKSNMSFRQQLENLTISNINSKTSSNTSINSSLLAYDNLILPEQSNNDEKEDFISYRAITMRKNSRPSEDIPVTNETLVKETKKSRKSLVITKRKDSANDILSNGQTMVNSEKQKLFFDPKKPKSTTTSTSKIAGQNQAANSDKQVIKRMLDELNKKFACEDKVIKISLSNKNQTSNVKKQKSDSSGKNFDRKKIRSEIAPVTNFNEKSNKKEAQKKSNQKEVYQIDLTDKNQAQKAYCQDNKKKNKGKTAENCFMSVTLNKTVAHPQNQQKADIDHQQLSQQRTKQSHSQMSKKNLNGKSVSQSSQENEICKILSKYRSKKPSIPECCMKIDLVTSKVNKVLNMAEKGGKQRNKIFFNNNQSLDKTKDYEFQFGQNESIGDPNLQVSKTYSRPSNDSYLIKRNSLNHLSSQTDSIMGEYVSMLPSNIYLHENQEQDDCLPYSSQKPQAVNTSLDASECFFTGSKTRLSSKPNSMNSSMDKKRASFERNLEEWDMMFEKQKSKFLKNENKMPKKKTSLNEQVITQIKQKIEQCLILNQKDTNAAKGPYLQMKKANPSNARLQEKNTVMSANNTLKMLSSSTSNRSSINRLYTTNKLTKRMES